MFPRPETGVGHSPGAAGEWVARPQLPQQVLLAVLGDQPPCAHAELGREADGDAASGAVARTFACTVSPRAFFPEPSRGGFCGVSVGLQSLVMFVVFSVCRVSVVLTVLCDLCVALCHGQYACTQYPVSSDLSKCRPLHRCSLTVHCIPRVLRCVHSI